MRQEWDDEWKPVLRNDEITAGKIRLGTHCVGENRQAPRRDAVLEAGFHTGPIHETREPLGEGVVDMDGRNRGSALPYRLAGNGRLQVRDDGCETGRTAGFHDLLRHLVARVTDFHYGGEPIALGFRKRERTEVFQRVLGGDDEVEFGEAVGFSGDGHRSFFHAFEKGTLRFRVHPVDFVDEDDLFEDRAHPQAELAARKIERFPSYDILRKTVGRTLDAGVGETEEFGESLGGSGLPYPWQILHEHVAADKERDFENFRDVGFSENEGQKRLVEILEFVE